MTAVTRTPTVVYVTGRRKALARAFAIEAARLQGHAWQALPESERTRLVEEADEVVRKMVVDGVLAEFVAEYRERK